MEAAVDAGEDDEESESEEESPPRVDSGLPQARYLLFKLVEVMGRFTFMSDAHH